MLTHTIDFIVQNQTISIPRTVSFKPTPFSLFLANLIRVPRNTRVAVDVGTGSGIQAVLLAKLGVPKIWAVDKYDSVVKQASITCHTNNVPPGVVCIVKGNILNKVNDHKLDLIVSNPPTMPRSKLSPKFTWGGKFPDEFVSRLIEEAGVKLRIGGSLQFVCSTLVDHSRVKHQLRSNGFVFKIRSELMLPFRRFYAEVFTEHALIEYEKAGNLFSVHYGGDQSERFERVSLFDCRLAQRRRVDDSDN
jgi:methylase of polypeptide subunit release factors